MGEKVEWTVAALTLPLHMGHAFKQPNSTPGPFSKCQEDLLNSLWACLQSTLYGLILGILKLNLIHEMWIPIPNFPPWVDSAWGRPLSFIDWGSSWESGDPHVEAAGKIRAEMKTLWAGGSGSACSWPIFVLSPTNGANELLLKRKDRGWELQWKSSSFVL